jgi:hypothetical protein
LAVAYGVQVVLDFLHFLIAALPRVSKETAQAWPRLPRAARCSLSPRAVECAAVAGRRRSPFDPLLLGPVPRVFALISICFCILFSRVTTCDCGAAHRSLTHCPARRRCYCSGLRGNAHVPKQIDVCLCPIPGLVPNIQGRIRSDSRQGAKRASGALLVSGESKRINRKQRERFTPLAKNGHARYNHQPSPRRAI